MARAKQIILAIILVVIFPFIANAQTPESILIEQEFASALPKTIAALKRDFPAEYQKMIKKSERSFKGLGSTKFKQARVQRAVETTFKNVIKRNSNTALRMSNSNLKSVLNSFVAIPVAMQRSSPSLCNQFLTRGSKGVLEGTNQFTRVFDGYIATSARAISATKKSPSARTTKPKDEDFVAVFVGKLSEEEIAILGKPKAGNPAFCRVFIKFLKVTVNAPGETGRRLRADIVKDLFKG